MSAEILTAAGGELEKFKAAYHSDLSAADALLGQLKLKLVQLPSLPPVFGASPTAQQELSLAREVYEHAALYSLCTKDAAVMERCFTQLKAFYADTRGSPLLVPARSPQEHGLIGLDLLRLLVQGRIAEFHTELELISPEDQRYPGIEYATQLEQWLMEGAYNKVLEASKKLPSEAHATLVQQVAFTVRDEIASCSEKAYARLRLSDAQKLMMLDSEAAIRDYASEHGWHVEADGYINFTASSAAAAAGETAGAAGAKDPGPPSASLALINNSLVYAKELERIV